MNKQDFEKMLRKPAPKPRNASANTVGTYLSTIISFVLKKAGVKVLPRIERCFAKSCARRLKNEQNHA